MTASAPAEPRYRITAYDPEAPHRILKREVRIVERDEDTGDVISERVSMKQLRHEVDGAQPAAELVARYVAEDIPVKLETKSGCSLSPADFSPFVAAMREVASR